jgi:hypothetical protein
MVYSPWESCLAMVAATWAREETLSFLKIRRM